MGLPQDSTTSSNDNHQLLIRVEQIPGKKGAFLKHVEYDVISQRARVNRRYNDFVVLHDTLLQVYPTRLIPRLPPKKVMGTDPDFLVQRQKALERYATLLFNHPFIGSSALFQHFITYTGKDLQAITKEKSKTDEYNSTPPGQYDSIRLVEWTTRLGEIKEQILSAENTVQKIRTAFEAINTASRDQVKNHMNFNLELSNLCASTTSPFVEFRSGNTVVNQRFTGILADVASEIAGVTKQWLELSNTEESISSDYLLMVNDLMKGWKDFFSRQNKYAMQDQKTLEKATNASQKKMEGETEKAVAVLHAENRMKFSLYCLQQESSFVEELLTPLVAKFVQTLAASEKRHFAKISTAWQDVEDVAGLLPLSTSSRLRVEASAPLAF